MTVRMLGTSLSPENMAKIRREIDWDTPCTAEECEEFMKFNDNDRNIEEVDFSDPLEKS